MSSFNTGLDLGDNAIHAKYNKMIGNKKSRAVYDGGRKAVQK